MAPTIKELSRWLDANSEYYVTPEWATVVKHSVSMTSQTGSIYFFLNLGTLNKARLAKIID